MQSNPIQIHQTTENKRILKIESNQKIQGGGDGTQNKTKNKTKHGTQNTKHNTKKQNSTVEYYDNYYCLILDNKSIQPCFHGNYCLWSCSYVL
jgi:hypothetical protein